MPTLAADVRRSHDRLASQGMLHSGAVLVAYRCLVVVLGNTRDAGYHDRQTGEAVPGHYTRLGNSKEDRVKSRAGAEWDICTSVVHIVALDALVHRSKARTYHRRTFAGQIVGKSHSRTKLSPVIVNHAMRNSGLTRDSDPV